MTAAGDALGRLRNPEYTGENRCMPCTVVNAILATLLAVTLAAWTIAAGGAWAAPFVILGTLVVSGLAIYLRGYLVPGTPTLTKRYFPPWLLSLFGKEPAFPGAAAEREPVEDLDVESRLLEIGAVEECRGGEDLCLTDEFEAAWDEEIDAVQAAQRGRDRLLDVLGVDSGEVTVEEHDDAFRVRHDGAYVGTWESRPAFQADVAAAELLADRSEDWGRLSVEQRGQVLHGLRLFLRSCPDCEGDVSLDVETVESCCTSHEVAALTCDDCGVRLLESGPVPG